MLDWGEIVHLGETTTPVAPAITDPLQPARGPMGCSLRFSAVPLDGATITAAGLDNLIDALTLARAEAFKLGLFNERPTPRAKLA